ncbi:unnamed protein product [Discula destructiva]
MRLTTLLAAVVATASPVFAETATPTDTASSTTATAVQSPAADPQLGQTISQGCFSSWGNLIFNGTSKYMSMGGCATDLCVPGGFLVSAITAGNECYCGNEYPPEDTLVDDTECNIGCPGWGASACGGLKAYSVFNNGIMLAVDYAAANTTASATGTGTVVASSTVVNGGQTSVVYVTSSPTAEPSTGGGSSPNIGGIVAGVVVGVVVLLAVAGGIFFWFRRRRNQEIEDEHRRNAAVNAFMKPPGSSSGYSAENDARMDPVMAQRRLSTGSIADNEDYSRKILRVTNA